RAPFGPDAPVRLPGAGAGGGAHGRAPGAGAAIHVRVRGAQERHHQRRVGARGRPLSRRRGERDRRVRGAPAQGRARDGAAAAPAAEQTMRRRRMKPNKCRNWAVAALAAVILCACQSVPSRWNDEVRASIDASMSARARRPSAGQRVPEYVREAMLPPLEVTIPGGRTAPTHRRFDLGVSNALARQVFMGLVEGTPYDIVLPPDVSGRVTLNLKDVTVPEALAALREAYGYEYRREGNRFFVLGRDLQTRLFQV